ncbi:hypothetical protein M011DRAFT_377026, partial [Sporormia fimetaria CBS 119925]
RRVVSQACDACRRRKIKCNGLQPCPGCQSAQLTCTFDMPQKRGGRQGARATVLNGLRESPRPVAHGSSGIEIGLVNACIDTFSEELEPLVPFLTREYLQAELGKIHDSPLSQHFVTAFTAYVVALAPPADVQGSGRSKQLLEAALRISVPERISTASYSAVFASFFLYAAHASLGEYAQGWFYLREAITLFMLFARTLSTIDGTLSRTAYSRLFWILVISERSHAIRKSRPITLQITSDSPTIEDMEHPALSFLASLFRPFDEVFFAVWNGARQDCTRDWLLRLETDVRMALPDPLDLPSEHIANLRVSQLWLQVKLWELFPRFGFLSSGSSHECLTFQYPISLARNLVILAVKLPITSLQIHGVGMTEKIFDVACALADILPFVSLSAPLMELTPVDYLTQITVLISKLPGSSKFIPLLVAKLNELLPELVQPLCASLEGPTVHFNPLSPGSRYLYEEEVGSSLYTDLRR